MNVAAPVQGGGGGGDHGAPQRPPKAVQAKYNSGEDKTPFYTETKQLTLDSLHSETCWCYANGNEI